MDFGSYLLWRAMGLPGACSTLSPAPIPCPTLPSFVLICNFPSPHLVFWYNKSWRSMHVVAVEKPANYNGFCCCWVTIPWWCGICMSFTNWNTSVLFFFGTKLWRLFFLCQLPTYLATVNPMYRPSFKPTPPRPHCPPSLSYFSQTQFHLCWALAMQFATENASIRIQFERTNCCLSKRLSAQNRTCQRLKSHRLLPTPISVLPDRSQRWFASYVQKDIYAEIATLK